MPRSFLSTDIFLHPGEFFVGDATLRIRTILGSCIAITLWHPIKRIGAMSHFLLAYRDLSLVSHKLDARYGDESMELLVQGLRRVNVQPQTCDAKIFGGGNMFQPSVNSTIGRRNGEAARVFLEERGISVHSEHVFGDGHRQIVFDIASGAVWVRQISASDLV